MSLASEIITKYTTFFTKQNHKIIANASLVPENDPTTLFTSSGMQPLVPYLLGEAHPLGKRLVNVQNCFRSQDIDEVGDNSHTTFFRMLGNWSLGDYFKKEQLPWFFEFLTNKDTGLGLDPTKLYVTVFEGFESIGKDSESIEIWEKLFAGKNIKAEFGERIRAYGVEKNWWSRSGVPDRMPVGEPGGPDSEVFYDFGAELGIHENSFLKNEECHPNCDCGRFIEIGNSVFMQYKKNESGNFEELPQKNVDFGGGLERFIMAVENKTDIFTTSLFYPLIQTLEKLTKKQYQENSSAMRIIVDHFVSAIFIAGAGVAPSNKEQGYLLRRLMRRGLDNFYKLTGEKSIEIIEAVVEQYKDTDPMLIEKFEEIKNVLAEEEQKYSKTRSEAMKFIEKELSKAKKIGDEIMMDYKEISAELAFKAISSYGLSPVQLESLGYRFDKQQLAEKIKEHQNISRAGIEKKFKGGLADTQELTIKGHTATHLLHQAVRDVLGKHVFQRGSNITTERVRFDFNFERKVTAEELAKIESIVKEKIKEDLPVSYQMLPLEEARKLDAIGLFGEKYADTVKVYSMGTPSESSGRPYSVEFCGGPHVEHTGVLKSFKIIKEEGVGKGNRRIYAIVE